MLLRLILGHFCSRGVCGPPKFKGQKERKWRNGPERSSVNTHRNVGLERLQKTAAPTWHLMEMESEKTKTENAFNCLPMTLFKLHNFSDLWVFLCDTYHTLIVRIRSCCCDMQSMPSPSKSSCDGELPCSFPGKVLRNSAFSTTIFSSLHECNYCWGPVQLWHLGLLCLGPGHTQPMARQQDQWEKLASPSVRSQSWWVTEGSR